MSAIVTELTERERDQARAVAAAKFDLKYEAEPTIKKFHRSTAFIRGIRGPVGSGKSSGCCVEIVRRGREQAPDSKGARRTRWGAIRNTYGELLTTTIKTWQDWCPASIAPLRESVPITSRLRVALPDGTTMDCEVIFVSVDRPADVAKLKSMDLTGLWLNEAAELDKSVLDMATTRHSRFPRKLDAPYTWSGVIMDTNSMDDLHWWYELAQNKDPAAMLELKRVMDELMAELGLPPRDLIEFFDQPPALLEVKHNDEGGISYVPNPAAENVRNHQLGVGYWYQQIAGKKKDWIDVFVLNKYGRVVDGKPIYPEYDENFHGKNRIVKPIPGLPIVIGMDYGLSPAAIPVQFDPIGQLRVLGELAAEERSMGAKQFCTDALKPYLVNRFGGEYQYRVAGDPAGSNRAEGDSTISAKGEVEAAGFEYIDVPGNNEFIPRRDAVAYYLTKSFKGEPGLLLDESCKLLKAGFAGRYHYRRIQVAGDPRYEEKAFKNHWSHSHDALQNAALVAHNVSSDQPKPLDETPAWMRSLLVGGGGSHRAYRYRGGNVR